MIRTTTCLLSGLVLVLWVAACGPDDGRGWSRLQEPIVNGEPDPSVEHMAVIYLSLPGGACTGTLITRDVVLTAGHCADQTSPSAYSVTFTDTTWYSSSAVTVGVSERLRHPFYDSQYILNDIALLRLDDDAPAGVEPIPPLPEHLKILSADAGEPIEFVGFGQTEAGPMSAGRKLHFVGSVRWICQNEFGCDFGGGVFGMPNTLCFDQAQGGTCSGDSGGPALFVRDNQEYVAGITSYGPQGSCFSYGCSTKVDEFETFISDFTGGGLGEACTANDQCLYGHCVAGTCCESTCDQICHSCSQAGSEGYCVVAENGASCSDGDACNGEEACILGECVPGSPPDCVGGDECTYCDPAEGCLVRPEGYACGDCQMCTSGVCVDANCSSGCGCSSGEPRGAGGLLLIAFLGLIGIATRRTV